MFSQLGDVKKYTKLLDKLSKRNKEKPDLGLEKKTVPITSVINTKSKSKSKSNEKSNEKSKTFVPSIFAKEEKEDDPVDTDEEEEEAKKKEEPPKSTITSFFSNFISTSDSKKNDKTKDEEEVQDHEIQDHEVQDKEEMEFILDKPDYIMQGVPYHYLNNTKDFMNSTLTREWIDSLLETGTSEIEIQVALYKWNGTIQYVPFITYLLEKQSDMYAFPRFTIPISKDKDEANDSLTEDILNHTCEKECKKRVFHHLHIRPNEHFVTSKVLEHIIFKGYVTREGGNELLAVFETKSELPDIRENCEWVTLHEMINTKFIHSYTIHPLVSTWFLENSALIYVTDKFGKSVEIPYVLYLLEDSVEESISTSTSTSTSTSLEEEKEEEEKEEEKKEEKKEYSIFDNVPSLSLPNMFSSKTKTQTKTEEENSKKSKYRLIENDYGLVPSHIHHPGLGKNIFLFSEKGTEVARTVVFITNTLYLLDQPPDFSLYRDRKKTFDSIYFQEDGEVRWGVEDDLLFTNQF